MSLSGRCNSRSMSVPQRYMMMPQNESEWVAYYVARAWSYYHDGKIGATRAMLHSALEMAGLPPGPLNNNSPKETP